MKYTYSVFVLFFGLLMSCAYGQEAKKKKLNVLEEAIVGAAAGVAEGVAGIPCNTVKNSLQRHMTLADIQKAVKRDPLFLWRGYFTNAAFMGPITCAQFGTNAGLNSIFPGEDESLTKSLAKGAASGVVPSVLASPCERIIMFQQDVRSTMFTLMGKIIQRDGAQGLWRGWPATAGRDAGFTSALLAGMPYVKEVVQEKTGSKFLATIFGAFAVGVPAGYATQWLDTVKTRQFEQCGKAGKTLVEATREVYAEDGLKALNRGLFARNIRIVLALVSMSTVRDGLTAVYWAVKNN